MKYRLAFTLSKIGFIICTPIVLLLLPGDFFDNGKSVCLSKFLFDFECYACGLTRGIMHLMHFQLEDAFAYNMLSFVVFPLLVVVWIQWLMKEWRIFKRLKASSDIVAAT